MTPDERLAWVAEHVEVLTKLLDRIAPASATQRIYRTRGILSDEYVVITLVQNLPGFHPQNGSPDVKVKLYVARPYQHSSFGATPTVRTDLVGQYAVDEIVAFLGLDRVDPESITWTDETRYISLVDAGTVLGSVLQG